jgi:hypothetical protein
MQDNINSNNKSNISYDDEMLMYEISERKMKKKRKKEYSQYIENND